MSFSSAVKIGSTQHLGWSKLNDTSGFLLPVESKNRRLSRQTMPKESNQFKPDFLLIPMVVREHGETTPADCFVFATIYWLTKQKGEKCFASNSYLAAVSGIKKSTARDSVSRLARLGFVSVVRNDGNNSREEIVCNLSFSTPSLKNDTPSLINDTPVVRKRRPPSLENEHNNNRVNEEELTIPCDAPTAVAGEGGDKSREAEDIVAVIDAFRDSGLWPAPRYGNKTERRAAADLARRFTVQKVRASVMRYAEAIQTNPYLPKGHKPSLFLENMALIAARINQKPKGGVTII